MIYFIVENIDEQITAYYHMLLTDSTLGFYTGGGNLLVRVNDDDAALDTARRMFNERPPGGDDIMAVITTDAAGLRPSVRANGAAARGTVEPLGPGIYMINALTGVKKDNFYPEMLFKHPFAEITAASQIYQRLTGFFAHHNVYFFVVIDTGAVPLLSWLDGRSKFKTCLNETILTADETVHAENIAGALKLTAAMRAEFMELIKKYKTRNGDLSIIFNYRPVPVSGKKEAKDLYDRLKRLLLE